MNENKAAEQNAEIQKIDITDFIDRFLKAFKRRWWAVVFFTVICTAFQYFRVSTTYVSQYVAEATLTVATTSAGQEYGASYTNISTAAELAKISQLLISNGLLNQAIKDDLGQTSIPVSISTSGVEDTNYLVIRVTGTDAQLTYDVLQSAIRKLPDVAQSVVGQIDTEVIMDSGVPSDTGKTSIIRGSVKKGALVGFAIGILIVLINMFLQHKIIYPKDIRDFLHVECMGVLPEVKKKKRRKRKERELNILDDSLPSEYLESIRSVRTRMEHKMRQEGKKTFLVTSSIAAEGKSTVSTNLALSFAKKGKTTVLIDCDLRHPSVQNVMGVEGQFPGLEKVLSGQATLKEALYHVPDDTMDMYVLFGASEPSDNVTILGTEVMSTLIRRLEEVSDVVILDTSPSAMLADAITLARNVEMALYVVRCDYARRDHILRGINELQDTGVEICGCVLNYSKHGAQGSMIGRSGYGYGYGYGYGKYGYGEDKTEKKHGKADLDQIGNEVSTARNREKERAEVKPVIREVELEPEVKGEGVARVIRGEDITPDVKPEARKATGEERRIQSVDDREFIEPKVADTDEAARLIAGWTARLEIDNLMASGESGKPQEEKTQQKASEMDEIDKQIKTVDQGILLTKTAAKYKPVYKIYRQIIDETERKEYVRKHRKELEGWAKTMEELKKRYPAGVPTLSAMEAERSRLLSRKEELS